MPRKIKLRYHHFNLLMQIWHSTKDPSGNPLKTMRKEKYDEPFIAFWKNLSDEIRSGGDDLLIESVPGLDTICEYCRDNRIMHGNTVSYNRSCEGRDSGWRNSNRLVEDMGLESGVNYTAKEIVKRMDAWAYKYPWLPLME